MDKKTAATALAELRGRRPWSEEEGRLVLEAWEASGDSVPLFARRAGLVPQRVYGWMKRLGREDVDRSALRVAVSPFVPVTVRSESAATVNTAVTVVTSDGLRIEVGELDAASAAWVATLVQTLREARS